MAKELDYFFMPTSMKVQLEKEDPVVAREKLFEYTTKLEQAIQELAKTLNLLNYASSETLSLKGKHHE